MRPTIKEEKIIQYDVHTRDCTCLKPKINANVLANKSIWRFKDINRFEYFKHTLNVIFFSDY